MFWFIFTLNHTSDIQQMYISLNWCKWHVNNKWKSNKQIFCIHNMTSKSKNLFTYSEQSPANWMKIFIHLNWEMYNVVFLGLILSNWFKPLFKSVLFVHIYQGLTSKYKKHINSLVTQCMPIKFTTNTLCFDI
jgi:hypothetical protein